MPSESHPLGRPDAGPAFVLDRRQAIPELIGEHRDFLIIAGLAGTAKDMTALTGDGPHVFAMAGAMGSATMIGLGLALAQPKRRVLVVTGDGEMLMNVGSLATVAIVDPPNLSIVCVDNGHYGETGYQKSHTSRGADLEKMARGAGIKITTTVARQDQIAAARRLIRESGNASFVVVRVKPTDPPKFKRQLDPAVSRMRFRQALLGQP